jgi:hypothetical protein
MNVSICLNMHVCISACLHVITIHVPLPCEPSRCPTRTWVPKWIHEATPTETFCFGALEPSTRAEKDGNVGVAVELFGIGGVWWQGSISNCIEARAATSVSATYLKRGRTKPSRLTVSRNMANGRTTSLRSSYRPLNMYCGL